MAGFSWLLLGASLAVAGEAPAAELPKPSLRAPVAVAWSGVAVQALSPVAFVVGYRVADRRAPPDEEGLRHFIDLLAAGALAGSATYLSGHAVNLAGNLSATYRLRRIGAAPAGLWRPSLLTVGGVGLATAGFMLAERTERDGVETLGSWMLTAGGLGIAGGTVL